MSIQKNTIIGPAILAPALINDDLSGLDDDGIELWDAFCNAISPWYVVAAVENSKFFTWKYRVYGGNKRGGTVMEYVLHKIS
jgi:hypothetical protein